MKREVDLKDISDGRLYGPNDMVKADCLDCKGCSACCRGMGESIVLDPLDVHRITGSLNCRFEELLADRLELNVVDGIVLPNLKMADSCSFLDSAGRCRIHPDRPGICRLFPLGRYYEDNSFRYFLQIHECRKTDRTKVKVRKWVDTPNLPVYEKYISDWHYLLIRMQEIIAVQEEEVSKAVSMYVLTQFYLREYRKEEDFYTQFYKKYEEAVQQCLAWEKISL